MNNYVVDRGIPIPQSKRGPGYPWHEMKVGDSFFVKHRASDLHSLAKDQGINITVRYEGAGIRVWRIE